MAPATLVKPMKGYEEVLSAKSDDDEDEDDEDMDDEDFDEDDEDEGEE